MDDGGPGADPTPVLDMEAMAGLEASVGADGLAELLALVPDTVATELGRLDAAFAADDLTGARRAAHSIKGFAGNLGLARLGAAAKALDATLRALPDGPGGDGPGGAASLHRAVRDAAMETLAALPLR